MEYLNKEKVDDDKYNITIWKRWLKAVLLILKSKSSQSSSIQDNATNELLMKSLNEPKHVDQYRSANSIEKLKKLNSLN